MGLNEIYLIKNVKDKQTINSNQFTNRRRAELLIEDNPNKNGLPLSQTPLIGTYPTLIRL